MYKIKRKNAKEEYSMAILTAKCDRPFIVSADKADEFKNQKRSERTTAKINKFASKFKSNPNTKIEIGNK